MRKLVCRKKQGETMSRAMCAAQGCHAFAQLAVFPDAAYFTFIEGMTPL